MNLDTELEKWRGEWQSDDAVPPDLRRRVERQDRWMRVMLAADVLVTVGIGGAVIILAARMPRPAMVVLAAVTWLFIAAAWAFRLTTNRGLGSPAAMDTAGYIELLIKRCRSQMSAVLFGAGLYAVEMAFCLGWVYRESVQGMTLGSWLWFSSVFIDCIWLFTIALSTAGFWYWRKKRKELAWLRSLER